MITEIHQRLTAAAPGRARAYCGPAHGRWWELDVGDALPAQATLHVGSDVVHYRLLHDPRRHRPARDQLGNYIYMPLRATRRGNAAA